MSRNWNHPTDCSGCPVCNAELASTMRMNSQELAQYLTRKTEAHMRTLGATPAHGLRAAADDAPPAPSLVDAIRTAAGATAPPAPLVVTRTATTTRTTTAAPENFPVSVSLVDNIRAAAAAARA